MKLITKEIRINILLKAMILLFVFIIRGLKLDTKIEGKFRLKKRNRQCCIFYRQNRSLFVQG